MVNSLLSNMSDHFKLVNIHWALCVYSTSSCEHFHSEDNPSPAFNDIEVMDMFLIELGFWFIKHFVN